MTRLARLRALLAEEAPKSNGVGVVSPLGNFEQYYRADVIARAFRRLPSPASQNVTISDEMVERALRKARPDLFDLPLCPCNGCTISHERDREVATANVRAILAAALSPSQKNTDSELAGCGGLK